MIVSLADMKTYLGISGTDDDAFLTSQIAVIQETIELYCQRKFDQATFTQTFFHRSVYPSFSVLLYQFPVSSITSITVDDNDPSDLTKYNLYNSSGKVVACHPFFLCGKQTVFVFVAGYLYANMPKPLQEVVYSLVAERYNKKKVGADLNFGTNIQRLSIPGTLSIDYDYTLSDNDRSTTLGSILGDYLNVLDIYRSERALGGQGVESNVD